MDESMQTNAEYARGRLRQLRERNFRFWVYRHDAIGCEGRHEGLDGLVLAPDHPFWQCYFPPLDGECGCYVVGAGLPGNIKRLGGDPDKTIPQWCDLPAEAPKQSLWAQLRPRR